MCFLKMPVAFVSMCKVFHDQMHQHVLNFGQPTIVNSLKVSNIIHRLGIPRLMR
jgi:hypothetical protein